MHRLWITATLIAGPAFAQPVIVTHPWARATAPGQTEGAAYLTVMAPAGDTLTDISTPAAGMAMLHQTIMVGGTSEMRDVDNVALPAGKPVALAPNGIHIMLMDLKKPLVAGGKITLQLSFAKAPPVVVSAVVAPIGARGPTP